MNQEQPNHSVRAFSVKPDTNLPQVTEAEYRQRAAEILRAARTGRQVAIVDAGGAIKMIVGMNCARFLPEPEVDPIERGDILADPVENNRVNPWVD